MKQYYDISLLRYLIKYHKIRLINNVLIHTYKACELSIYAMVLMINTFSTGLNVGNNNSTHIECL